MTFKIDRGIPIPEPTTRSGGNMDLLRQMEVGDSVYFAPDVVKKATRFYRVAKKLGVSIVIRKDGKGMRMWRTTTPIEQMATPVAMAAVKARVPARKKIAGGNSGKTKKARSAEQKAKDAAKAKARRATRARVAAA